jgi:hypothetical protein
MRVIKKRFYFLRYPLGVALLLAASGLASGADAYYLKDDGSRWLSADGTPIKGIHKSSLLICKQGGTCLDLMDAGREMHTWRQRGTLWQEVNSVRQQLEASDSDQVDLDTEIGRLLYNSAEIGSRKILK